MTRLRLAYIARRFRPLPGGIENTAMRLLGELVRGGHTATVVTPKWQADWPEETDFAGVRVLRIAPPGRGCWGELGYARRLTASLKRLGESLDVAIVSGLRADAYTAVRAAKKLGVATMLQPERPGLAGDCHWQINDPSGRRIKRVCFSAGAFIAVSPLVQRELTAAGYARSRIHAVTLGVPGRRETTAAQRDDARRSLALADPALVVPAGHKLAVYVGRLRLGKGLDDLLAAWRSLIDGGTRAVLWLVGEGPDASLLRERIVETGLVAYVKLTGAFDDVEDAFRAADLAVFPSREEGMAIGLLEAASFGLPIVATRTATHLDLLNDGLLSDTAVGSEAEAAYVPKRDPAALARALAEVVGDAGLAARLGSAARRRAATSHSLDAMVDEYERLLLKVAGRVPAEAAS